MPEPTVTVRMKEDKTDIAVMAPAGRLLHTYLCLPFHALILVLVLFRSLTMNQSLLSEFGDPIARVEAALAALRAGRGVLVADDEDRENEGDLIFAAESMTNEQMAMMIRECSGIVCLCLTDERVRQLELPMMVEANSSHYQTAFTVTIEAAQGVTTGVSAADRITTIQAAIADGARPSDLHRPGHVFPLRARTGPGLAEKPHLAGIRFQKAKDDAGHGGLAGTGLADDPQGAPGAQLETHPIDHLARLLVRPHVTFTQLRGLQHHG